MKLIKTTFKIIVYILVIGSVFNLDGVTSGDKIIEFLIWIDIMVIPTILIFNTFSIRDRLPVFKNKSKLSYVIVAIICIIIFNKLTTLYSAEYKTREENNKKVQAVQIQEKSNEEKLEQEKIQKEDEIKEAKKKEDEIKEAKKKEDEKKEAKRREDEKKEAEKAKIKAQKEYLNSPEYYKSQCVNIDYLPLVRNPKDYIGKNIVNSGRVVSVSENKKTITCVVDVGENSLMLVTYSKADAEFNILENDYISSYGKFKGTTSEVSNYNFNLFTITQETKYYDRVMPHINAKYIEIAY